MSDSGKEWPSEKAEAMSEITVFNARPQGSPQSVVRAVLESDHLSALAAKDAQFGVGPHLLTARDGIQALCGGSGVCPACIHGDKLTALQEQVRVLREASRRLFESHCLNSGHRVDQMCPICASYFLLEPKQ